MGFGKKNKGSGKAPGKDKKGKDSKKPNVSMNRKKRGHALTISVKESATELLNENAPFIVNGRTVGAATSITQAVGDLSNKKDADIGQIVSYINHGTISAIVLEMLLNDDTIIIIPDSATIDTMRTYDSFKNADYEFCYVDLEEGSIVPCFEEEIKVSFQELSSIASGRESLADRLGITDSSASSESDDLWDDDDDSDELNDPLYTDNASDVGDEFGEGFDEAFDEFGDEPAGDEFGDNNFDEFQADAPGYDDYAQDVPDESEAYDPFEETTQETISQVITREFMVDDISLTVSDEPFRMHFNNEDVVLFDENRPTKEDDGIVNHLNECLNNMSKAANAEIKQTRALHLNELKTTYMNALGEYVQTVINSELSTFGDTASAQERRMIDEAHQKNIDNLEDEVDARKANIDREYNEAIMNVRNAAAENAEHEYRENHQKQYIAQIDSIRNTVEQEIENQYINDIAKQNEKRHHMAMELLDEAVVNILEELTVKYADMVSEERDIYEKHMTSIIEFTNKQRHDEINRINVLKNEHDRVDLGEKLAASHAAELADVTAKFNAKQKNLESDLAAMRDNVDIAVTKATAEADRTILSLRAENQRLAEDMEKANRRVENADERAEAKYKEDIEKLNKHILNWENESAKTHNLQKTSMLVTIGLAVAAVIAAGAIGYISGQSKQAKEYANSTRIESSENPGTQNAEKQPAQAQQNPVQQNQQDQAPAGQPQAEQGTGQIPSGSVSVQQ